MAGEPETFLSRVVSLWSGMSQGSRLAVSLLGVALAGALALFVALSLRGPEYSTIYRTLDSSDAAEMIQVLDQEKVPYRISEGGTAIEVLAKDADRTRLMLAGQGLPRGGGVGFEILDKASIGSSESERHSNYVRALQGELARTLLSIAQVEQARVHIVMPEPSLFVSQARPATAAVLLKLKPTAKLDQDQVRGILHLVSHSVEGLTPDNVTVVDFNGRILSAGIADTGTEDGGAQAHLGTLRSFQHDLQSSLETLLEQVFGPNNVLVRVTADMDFDQRIVERNLFEPSGTADGLVRSVQELEEVFRGAGGIAGGIPTQGDIPGYPTSEPGSAQEYQRTEVTKNVEINQIQERIIVAPGAVKRLSVAVVLNRDLTAQEAAAVEETVAAAIGFDPARDDRVTVTGISFDTSWMDGLVDGGPLPAEESRFSGIGLPHAIAGAGGLAVLLFLARSLRKKKGKKTNKVVEPARLELPKEVNVPSLLSAIEKRKGLNEVERLVKEKPEAAAQLIQAWLTEDQM